MITKDEENAETIYNVSKIECLPDISVHPFNNNMKCVIHYTTANIEGKPMPKTRDIPSDVLVDAIDGNTVKMETTIVPSPSGKGRGIEAIYSYHEGNGICQLVKYILYTHINCYKKIK